MRDISSDLHSRIPKHVRHSKSSPGMMEAGGCIHAVGRQANQRSCLIESAEVFQESFTIGEERPGIVMSRGWPLGRIKLAVSWQSSAIVAILSDRAGSDLHAGHPRSSSFSETLYDRGHEEYIEWMAYVMYKMHPTGELGPVPSGTVARYLLLRRSSPLSVFDRGPIYCGAPSG